MLLNEIFGMGKKKEADPGDGLSPDEKEEMRRQRVNTLRTSDKPAAGEIVDKKVAQKPETMEYEEFLEWLGKALETQGRYESEGPQAGDFVMSKKLGPLTVVDPNGGGNMVAIVKQGDKQGKMSWDKLSKPVKGSGKQYYAYG